MGNILKKTLIMLITLLMLVIALAACTPDTVVLPENDKKIDEVQGIAAEDVAYIKRYDGSAPPDTAAGTWCSDDDIAAMMAWFKGIRLTEKVSDENPGAEVPGAGAHYSIQLFDGSRVRVWFSLGTVKTEDGWYNYTGERPEDDGIVLWIDEYSADTGEIAFVISKHNELQYYAFGAPILERMTETGWEEVDVKKASSAVRQPLEKGRNTFYIGIDGLEAGTYRVSQTVAKGEINLDHVEYETYSGILEIQ